MLNRAAAESLPLKKGEGGAEGAGRGCSLRFGYYLSTSVMSSYGAEYAWAAIRPNPDSLIRGP